jgi:hypothetical protein
MNTDAGVARVLEEAREHGYRWTVRHQPAAEHEFPDWIVVIHTPDGRVLFPPAVDDDEEGALRRAVERIQQDLRVAAAHG